MGAVVKGWLNDGVGDGSWASLIPMVAHSVTLESADVADTLGLDGSTLHASTGAGRHEVVCG
jgi:hypothetical protein